MSIVPIVTTQMMNTANIVNANTRHIAAENCERQRRIARPLSPTASLALVIGSSVAIAVLIVLFTCVIASNFNPNLANLFNVMAASPAFMYGIPLVLVIVLIGVVLWIIIP